jgi:glycosyltransferase involved in cell wall biosynthesis
MAIVEAMACERPVVITDRVNICREVEKAGAGIVTSCDPVNIAEALIKILKNPEAASDMGKKGRKFVEHNFTWDKAAGEMIKVYEDILVSRKGEMDAC